MKFLIGYEVPTGAPVEVRLHHLFVSGITQHSGKTTSLEAFLSRIRYKALVFRTGRGEIGFVGAKRIPPFFRERTDWKFVESLLSAHLREKMKFYRGDIMRATRGAKNLDDIHANVKAALAKAREGSFPQKILTELAQYFDEVIPVIRKMKFSRELELREGLNMIDLEGVDQGTQALVIASCVDYIMDNLRDTIVVIPEAWNFIPEERGSPVKLSVENMIRQGAKIGNYVWLDSQQLTGVDMDILRNVDLWLFGRQTLDLEKERVAKSIPGTRIRADTIHGLKVGYFYLSHYAEKGERDVRLVYVRPEWLPESAAVAVAQGRMSTEATRKYKDELDKAREADDMVYKEELEETKAKLKQAEDELELRSQQLFAVNANSEKLRRDASVAHEHDKELSRLTLANEQLRKDVERLRRERGRERGSHADAGETRDEKPGPVSRIGAAAQPAPQLGPIDIEAVERIVYVSHSEDVRTFQTTNPGGRIMYVLLNDLMATSSGESDIADAMREHGWNYGHSTMAPELSKLVKAGDVVKDGERPAKYRVPGRLKITVKEAK